MIPRPPGADWLGYLAGMKWPDGNEDSLWAMAEDWHTHADQMRALGDHIDVARAAAQVAYPFGDGGEAMAAELEKMRSGNGSIEELAGWMDKIGNSAHGMGTETEYTKIMFYATLVTLAIDLAAAPLTGPLMGEAEAVAVGAARVAVRFLTRRLLSEAAKKAAESAAAAVVRYTVRHVALNTIIGTATDAGIQAAQMIEGTRDNFDFGQLGITALTSAGAGAIGGPIGAGIGKGLTKPLSNMLGNRAGTYISHAAGGAIGGGVAGGVGGLYSLATGGDFDWRTVTGGAAQGATAGLRHGAIEAGRNQPKTVDATAAHPSDLTHATPDSESPKQQSNPHTVGAEQSSGHPGADQGSSLHPADAPSKASDVSALQSEHQADPRAAGLGDSPQHAPITADNPRLGENHSGGPAFGDPSAQVQVAPATDRTGMPSATGTGSPAHTDLGSASPSPVRNDVLANTKPAEVPAAPSRPASDLPGAQTARPTLDPRSALPTDTRSGGTERPESSPLQTRHSGVEAAPTSPRDPQVSTDRTVQPVSEAADQRNTKPANLTGTPTRIEPAVATPIPVDRAPADRPANRPGDPTGKPGTTSPTPEHAPRKSRAEDSSHAEDANGAPDADHEEASPRSAADPDDGSSSIRSEDDQAIPARSDDEHSVPTRRDDEQPAPSRDPEHQSNPDRPESLTPHLKARFEDLRARATEIVLADTDSARQHELPALRAEFAEQFEKLGLDADRAATPWRLLEEHQPQLAKYLGDNEKFFLPDHSETPKHGPEQPSVDHPNTDPRTRPNQEAHEEGSHPIETPVPADETAATNAEVDQVLGEINIKFEPNHSAYSENCTSCVQAYEIRRRGLTGPELTAGPLEKPLRTEEGGPGGRPISEVAQAWGGQWQAGTRAEIEAAFSEPGSRGAVFIDWKTGGGHVFNVENVGGTVRFVDGQPIPPVVDAAHYFDHGTNTQYIRLDDKPTPPFAAVEEYVELAPHAPEETPSHQTHPEPTSENPAVPAHPSEPRSNPDSSPDRATPQSAEHPENDHAPSHPREEQPTAVHDTDHQPNPDRPDSLTPYLKGRFEELRALSREIVLADSDPARQHELPGLRADLADRFEKLGLSDTDRASTPWRLLDEHQPALAKYLGDNEKFFLPDRSEPAGSGLQREHSSAAEREFTAGAASESDPPEAAVDRNDDSGKSPTDLDSWERPHGDPQPFERGGELEQHVREALKATDVKGGDVSTILDNLANHPAGQEIAEAIASGRFQDIPNFSMVVSATARPNMIPGSLEQIRLAGRLLDNGVTDIQFEVKQDGHEIRPGVFTGKETDLDVMARDKEGAVHGWQFKDVASTNPRNVVGKVFKEMAQLTASHADYQTFVLDTVVSMADLTPHLGRLEANFADKGVQVVIRTPDGLVFIPPDGTFMPEGAS
ncbi:toxin glutamine deamidase domain-containing protein [Nocardia sp. CDC153]|uniref:WXG100-like domain-containing protein n=1 Tax=Nocardia sp. CDC153 TaxID=3112167 RepID=UPI002DBABE3D|nr:toxin glutamine deamidase domain-containing protein [Nocardia sp. CDC153]MEC3952997.1 toxin glutamine deamidase domain-containing protein [Nocardia sp. CDC153]